MTMEVVEKIVANCVERECAPPYGDKKDCEFYEDGVCKAQTTEEVAAVIDSWKKDLLCFHNRDGVCKCGGTSTPIKEGQCENCSDFCVESKRWDTYWKQKEQK